MHRLFIAILFVFLAGIVGSAFAMPCGSWSFERNPGIILTHPVQQEIYLVTFVEEGAPGVGENHVQSDNMSADDLDDKQSGEVVDSAANAEPSTDALVKSEVFPTNKTQEISHQVSNATQGVEEDVDFTTETRNRE